jgi:hypothetical protein
MRRFQLFWAVLLIFSAAMASYVVSLHVGERYDRVRDLQKQMRTDRDAIRMLETELTYRASPQRLQALIDVHGLQLGLPKADQYLVSAVDLAPQPGAPASVQQAPYFATAPAFVPPMPSQSEHTPVQLASLESGRAVSTVLARAESALQNKTGVSFAEAPAPDGVLPSAVDASRNGVVRSLKSDDKKSFSRKSTSPRAAKAVDGVAIKTTKPQPSTAISSPKVVSKAPAPKITVAMTPVAAREATSKKPVDAKPVIPRESKSRRLDSALIASIETAAVTEAQKR